MSHFLTDTGNAISINHRRGALISALQQATSKPAQTKQQASSKRLKYGKQKEASYNYWCP